MSEIIQLAKLKQQLTPEESSQFDILYYEHRKDPTLTIVLSILTGYFAVDRFYSSRLYTWNP